MNRRRFLTLLAVTASGGCLSGEHTTDTPTPACKVAKSELSAEPATLSTEQREYLVPVEFDELSADLRPVFDAAVERGTVRGDCPNRTRDGKLDRALPDAIRLVADKLRAQARLHNGAKAPRWVRFAAYLRYDGELYALGARLSDMGVSSPIASPGSSETPVTPDPSPATPS